MEPDEGVDGTGDPDTGPLPSTDPVFSSISTDRRIAFFQAQLATDAGFTNVIRYDREVKGHSKTWRVHKPGAGTYYVRVRSVDEFGNASAWVGNNDANAIVTAPTDLTLAFRHSGRPDFMTASLTVTNVVFTDEDISRYQFELREIDFDNLDGPMSNVENSFTIVGPFDSSEVPMNPATDTPDFDVFIEDEQMTVTSISGGSNLQWNVTRPINSTVAVHHDSGKRVWYFGKSDKGDSKMVTEETSTSTTIAIYHNCDEGVRYRARVRAIDRQNRHSGWSGWTSIVRAEDGNSGSIAGSDIIGGDPPVPSAGPTGATGPSGPSGPTGVTGTTGSSSGSFISYQLSTTTTDADPGAGFLRLDNATQNLATTIRADLLELGTARNVTAILDYFGNSVGVVKGTIRIAKSDDDSKWLAFNVTSVASPSGYRNVSVKNTGSSASNPFANNDVVSLSFIPVVSTDGIVPNRVTGLTLQGGPGYIYAEWNPDTATTDTTYYDLYISDKTFVAKAGLYRGQPRGFDSSMDEPYTSLVDSRLQTISVVAAARTYTRSAGSFVADGFVAGQPASFTGFTNAGNNTTKMIQTVTSTVITVTDGVGLVDETGNADERARQYATRTLPTEPVVRTLLLSTSTPFAFINTLADGSPLEYFQEDTVTPKDYFVQVVSRDIDGEAAASSEVVGQMKQIDGPDIVVGAIVANSGIFADLSVWDAQIANLTATKLLGGNLASTFVLTGQIISPAVEGTVPSAGTQGLVWDATGLHLYDDIGSLVVDLPAVGSSPALVSGSLVADSLAVNSSFTYRDPTGKMETASSLTLQSGTSFPGTPQLIQAWPAADLPTSITVSLVAHPVAQWDAITYDPAGDVGGATQTFLTLPYTADSFSYSGVSVQQPLFIAEVDAATLTTLRIGEPIDYRLHALEGKNVRGGWSNFTDLGVTRCAGFIYVLISYNLTGGAHKLRWLSYNQSDLSFHSSGIITGDIPSGGYEAWITRNDEAVLATAKPVVVYVSSSNFAVLKTYNTSSGSLTSVASTITTTGFSNSTQSPWGCIFDGSNIWIAWAGFTAGASGTVKQYTNAGAQVNSTHDFYNSSRGFFGGIAYKDSTGEFYSCDDSTVTTYGLYEWELNGPKWWAASTWINNAMETTVGNRRNITLLNRSFLSVTIAGPYPTGGTGGWTAGLYLQHNATDPDVGGYGNMRLQATLTDPTTQVKLDTYTNVSATDPLTNGIPTGGVAAQVTTSGGKFLVTGDDTFTYPSVSCRAFKSGSAQTVTSGNTGLVSYQSVDWDITSPAAIHDTGLSTSKFIVPAGYGGFWRVTWHMEFDSDANNHGRARVNIRMDAAGASGGGTNLETWSGIGHTATGGWGLWGVGEYAIAATHYIEMFFVSLDENRDIQTGTGNTSIVFEYCGT